MWKRNVYCRVHKSPPLIPAFNQTIHPLYLLYYSFTSTLQLFVILIYFHYLYLLYLFVFILFIYLHYLFSYLVLYYLFIYVLGLSIYSFIYCLLFIHLSLIYLFTYTTAPNGQWIMTWKACGSDVIWGTTRDFTEQRVRKPMNTSVRIASIRSQNLSNITATTSIWKIKILLLSGRPTASRW